MNPTGANPLMYYHLLFFLGLVIALAWYQEWRKRDR